jgi:hypothetical protein
MKAWQDIIAITQHLERLIADERWSQAEGLVGARDQLLRTFIGNNPELTSEQTLQLNDMFTQNNFLQETLRKQQKRVAEQLNHLQQFKKFASEYEKHSYI